MSSLSLFIVSAAALALVFRSEFLHAAPAKLPSDLLAVLIKHGLPDVRGAQRVSVEYLFHLDTFGDPPGPPQKRVKENCWLLHEEPGGRLTLLMKEVRVVHGQRVTSAELDARYDQFDPLPEMPEMIVTPVDLQTELRQVGQRVKQGAVPTRPKNADEAEQLGAFGHERLLFLAHLQHLRQPGVSALVARLFPARALPDLLDDAWQSLASGRLESTCDRWIESGDAAAYVAELEALLKDAPRGWEKRAAVRLLADNARKVAVQPPENEAAEVLVNLRIANLTQLPLDECWLLPNLKEPPLWPGKDEVDSRQLSWDDRTIWVTPEADTVAAQTPVATFFRRGLPVAQMLLPLLKDRRPTRLLHPGDIPLWTEPAVGLQLFSGPVDSWREPADPRAQRLHKSYGGLYRTYEVRELAFKLLGSIYPEYIYHQDEFESRLTDWLRKLEGKNEEGIAWTCIELSAQPSDTFFAPAVALLVERRPPESAERLRNLLCDPMIWDWRLVQLLAPLLPGYVDSLGQERKGFVQDLLAAVKVGIESRPEGPYEADGMWGRGIRWSKEEGIRAMKLMRLLTEQPTVIGLVNRFTSLEDAEADAAFDALSIFVRGHFDRELEAHLLQTAARLKDRKRRLQLLEIAPHTGGTIQPGTPMDEATRAAVTTLLADPSDEERGYRYSMKPAELAAYALLRPRMSPELNAQWLSFRAESERLARLWTKLAVAAAQDGKALPPIPDEPDFTGAEISALAASWQDRSGPEVLAAFEALPPESQLRLTRGLRHVANWEAPFIRAQLTITAVGDDEAPALTQLKGRVFDQKLRDDMAGTVRAAAARGRKLELVLRTQDGLTGLSLILDDSTDRTYMMSRARLAELGLPGLKNRPSPDIEFEESLGFWRMSNTQLAETRAVIPLWKNAAITAAWQREFGGRSVFPKKAGDPPVSKSPAQAALFERIERGEPRFIRTFQYEVRASPIVE